jgi:26S proteasome regulatory subunit N9
LLLKEAGGTTMATAMDVDDALEAQKKAHPEFVEDLDNIHKLATEKLYHQLTLKLLEYLSRPCFTGSGKAAAASELLAFFNGFIRSHEKKFNRIIFLRLVDIVASPQAPEVALDLILSFEASNGDDRDAKFFWQALKAEKLTLCSKYDEAKDELETLDKAITAAYEVDAVIQAAFHKTYALLWKKLERWSEFFKSSLMYLAFTPLQNIPEEERPQLAFEVGVAALIAPEEFIFGELVQQEILKSMDGTPQGWLKDVLVAFAEGKFDLYDKALKQHQPQIDATPQLKTAESAVLRPKMAALALMELAFRKPIKERRLGFEELAAHCRVGVKEVEHLVMKAMCAELIRGKIDEVDQVVIITWVKPRILDSKRIDCLRERMDTWTQTTDTIVQMLEKQTPELLMS